MKLYRETEFQETPIGKIPKDWELVKLSDIAEDIYYGITAKAVENKTELKMLRTTDIKDYNVNWDSLPFCEITEKRGDIQRFLLKKGDLIIARAGTTGVSVLVEKDLENVIFGSYLIKVKLNRRVYPKFIHHFCQSHLYWDHITSSQVGSTLKNISLPILKSLNIPLPPSIKEQQKIAEILSRIDSAIERVDNAVARLNNLKKALMDELLTGRIRVREENGKLTFHTETEFQETEIGKIPKEWEVVKLDNKELAEIIMGQSPPSSTYNREGKGLPFLQGKMEFGYIYPSPRMYCLQPIKIAEPNDILISVRAPVGDINIAPYKLCIGRGLAAIRFNLNRASHWFYFYYFQKIKNFLENLGKGSTFKAITKEDLENLKVPYPSLFEQQRIADILSTVDRIIELYYKEKDVLGRLKKGLMDVLLTGKVRVRED
jgi:type I restriction enzyme S subunit